jgi:hypothetical protein
MTGVNCVRPDLESCQIGDAQASTSPTLRCHRRGQQRVQRPPADATWANVWPRGRGFGRWPKPSRLSVALPSRAVRVERLLRPLNRSRPPAWQDGFEMTRSRNVAGSNPITPDYKRASSLGLLPFPWMGGAVFSA